MTLVYKNIFPFAILISFVFVQNTCAALNNTADLKERKASVLFQENKGQVHDQNNNSRTDILYSGINGNMSFYLKENGMNYQLMRVDEWKRELKDSLRDTTSIKVPSKYTIQRLDISWVGANPNPQIETLKPTKDFENFYLPSCPDGALGVKSYEEVTYKEIYNGIDLIFHNKYNSLNYDFKVKPGVDYHQIKIEIKGADKINLTKEGDVIISTPLGDIVEGKPIVYQQGKLLESNWVLEDSQLRFNIKNVDSSYELLIDPLVRNWGTYYGGNFNETENNGACTTDKLGNVFIGGGTVSTTNIATSGVFQTALSESATINAYVAKFNNTGNRLWGTYYGGNSTTWLNSLEADNHGNIYACGETFADSGLSSVGAHQLLNTDGFDAFLVKFNINGERIWGTFYGGWGWDHGSGCSIDKNGYIYMAGHTSSNNLNQKLVLLQEVISLYMGKGLEMLFWLNSIV
jgi:hypothetical protein